MSGWKNWAFISAETPHFFMDEDVVERYIQKVSYSIFWHPLLPPGDASLSNH